MIKGQEKLSYVEYQSTYLNIFNPARTNYMSKKYAHIKSRSLFKSTKLVRINKVVGDCIKLHSFPNKFFNKFIKYV